MVSLINRYSFVFIGVLVLAVAGYFLLRNGITREGLLLFIGITLGLGAVWFVIRPQKGVSSSSYEIQSQIGAGIPVLLEFQSPY
jgi:hypothetical protein